MNMKLLMRIICSIYLLLVIYYSYIQIKWGEYLNLFISLLAIIIFILPLIINKFYKIKEYIKLIYYFFLLLAFILGILFHFYYTTLYFDLFVHFLFGFLLTIIIKDYTKLPNGKHIFIIISLVMFVGLCWEFLEFFSDLLINTDHQRFASGSTDTMTDLLMTLIGSIFYLSSQLFVHKIKQ